MDAHRGKRELSDLDPEHHHPHDHQLILLSLIPLKTHNTLNFAWAPALRNA
jgi:hypothetical protein